ncbi:hypothetical protein C8R46DRAFT_901106 [Mycena filopes]|nr:hypothetical protein C8R46DRAFT_901106 [Mycena filopes]
MKECGTPEVPSFYALRKLQAKLTKEIGLKPRHHTSSLGNQFYMNHPIDLIRLDFANPLVRESIHFYPEITSTVSEFWQAAKYVDEVDLDELSPMWADWVGSPYRHFYVKELAQCRNGTFVVPIKWVVFQGVVHAESYQATREQSGIFTVESHQILRIPASELLCNALDLAEQGEIRFSNLPNTFLPHILHPVRATAAGRPVFVLRIMPWADDVSGNRSKQYNAHMNMYFANTNLPHKKLAQEYFVRFCSTSPHASALEQFDALAEDCNATDWAPAYDCSLRREILFQVRAHLLPADNPQQAESTSTSGANATWWCREDKSGGSDAHRETDGGYHALFGVSFPRTPQETVQSIKAQIKAACLGVAKGVEKLQTETGVKDKISTHWINLLIEKARALQQEQIYNADTRDARLNDRRIKGDERTAIKDALITKIQDDLFRWVIMQPSDRYDKLDADSPERDEIRAGDHYNVLLRVRGLDPHRDSPCEILHTILLGEDKYVWHETNKSWNEEQCKLFADRLQSASTDGLSIPALRASYMVQYKNSLIGKHFKSIQQLAVFHLDDKLCSPQVFNLWRANGELGALLWYTEIKDMTQYLADLQVAIDNVLDNWAIVDPTRIIKKFKLHVLPHTPEHVRRFGPAPLFATEVFECWNAVFRLCSVLSNHQAPSLDISTTIADMERFKHQVSGGWWTAGEGGDWIQGGTHVRNFLTRNKQLQRRLGWTDPDLLKPGSAKLMPKKKQNSSSWKTALGDHWTERTEAHGKGYMWNECKYVVSKAGDICGPGSWIFFKLNQTQNESSVIAGRVVKSLLPDNHSSGLGSFTVVEQFNVSDANDARLNMPLLLRAGRSLVVAAKDILFQFNAQHDCRHCECQFVTVPGPRQERQASKLTGRAVAHTEDSRYHLNMHALHNAHLIRETLPRHLTAPKPCFTDRRSKHDEFAAVLREIGPVKRADIVAKTQATKQRNKQDKAEKLAGAQERGTDIS